jgi:integrase
MAKVAWEKVETGIWRRAGADGRAIYRAVRQAGRDPESGKHLQETETFNGSKMQGALREARTWRAEATVQQSTGPRTVNAAAKMTLQAAFDWLHDGHIDYAPATVDIHRQAWRALTVADKTLTGRRLKDVNGHMLRAALSKIAAPVMRDKARVLVHTIYRSLEVTPNPAVKAYTPKTRASKKAARKVSGRYLETGAVERLLAALPARYRTLVRILWRVGLRPGELFALQVGKYDPAARTLTIDRAVNRGVISDTKTGENRVVVLPSSVAKDLEAHILKYSSFTDPEALIFTNESGGMIDLGNWRRRVFQPAARTAGIEGATVYDFRHTACSNMVAAGVDLVTVAGMAGHNVQVLISTYAHEVEDAKRAAADRLDEVIRAGAEPALA